MGKLDDLRKGLGSHVAESIGGTVVLPGNPGADHLGPMTLPARLQGLAKVKNVAEIPVDRIVPDPDQPRTEFEPEALGRLAESLKAKGQLQPIRVRWDEAGGVYVVMVGERRWRAAMLAGLPSVQAVVVEGAMDASERLVVQLVENCLREDLRPIEQALAFRRLMDANGWPGVRLAKELGLSQPYVAKALALLELPEAVQEQVEQGALAPATAYEVSKAEPSAQEELAREVVAGKLTRQEAVAAVRRSTGRKGRGRKATSRVIRTSAGYKVTLEHRKGVDPESMAAALREALGQLEATLGDGQQAA